MMTGRELVTRALKFANPERLPFCQADIPEWPNDMLFCVAMDQHKGGWSLTTIGDDDWGCKWQRLDTFSVGQVVGHPIEDWSAFDRYRPPDPRDPFYYDNAEPIIAQADDRYVVVTRCMNLIERHHCLRGFANAMMDYFLEPEKTHRLLDMVLEHRLAEFEEMKRRFGDRVQGVFLTDDWGTQTSTFISEALFREFFFDRYRRLVQGAHDNGFQVCLHSCGRVNDFVPLFIEIGFDALSILQPRLYGIEEIGRLARGKIAFFALADIQSTLPEGDPEMIRDEVFRIVEHWSTPEGGLVAQGAMGLPSVSIESARIMTQAFKEASEHFGKPSAAALA